MKLPERRTVNLPRSAAKLSVLAMIKSERSVNQPLFLSEVRGRQTGGAVRPVRVPPPRRDVTVDMTPEEFAAEFGGEEAADERIPQFFPPLYSGGG